MTVTTAKVPVTVPEILRVQCLGTVGHTAGAPGSRSSKRQFTREELGLSLLG